MGLKLSFFKTPKNRVFNYQPLYYDERKEELEQRIARAKDEAKSEEWAAQKAAENAQSNPENQNQSTDKTRLNKDNPHYVPGKNIRHNFRKSLYENRRRPGSPFLMRMVVLLSMIAIMIALYYVAQAFGLFFV